MTERIDRYLDGDVDRDALTADEQEHAHAAELIIEQARAFLTTQPAPDLTADVMRRIETLGVLPARPTRWHALGRLAERVWAPRYVELHWRPAYALFAVAAVIVLVSSQPKIWQERTGTPSSAGAAGQGMQLFVQFRLDAADAMDVRLAGTFTNWEPRYQLHQTAPGTWTITLPLSAGVHDYVFVVDGRRWIPDPYAPQVDDGFGGVNSRIALVPPDSPRS